jgi:hypothetical protein
LAASHLLNLNNSTITAKYLREENKKWWLKQIHHWWGWADSFCCLILNFWDYSQRHRHSTTCSLAPLEPLKRRVSLYPEDCSLIVAILYIMLRLWGRPSPYFQINKHSKTNYYCIIFIVWEVYTCLLSPTPVFQINSRQRASMEFLLIPSQLY